MFEIFFLLWFIIWGIVAAMIYNSAKERGMDAGLWAIIIFIFGIFGFVLYLFMAMDKSPTQTTKEYITPQYQRYIENKRRNKTEVIKKNEDWNVKMYYNRGKLDSQTHKDLSYDEVNNIKNMFYNIDPNLAIVLPAEHYKLLENEYYRNGYLSGINTLVNEKNVDQDGQPRKKYSTL